MYLSNVTAPGYANAFAACSSILASLGASKVAVKGSEEWEAGRTTARDYFNQLQKPACIVFPEAAEDVQTAMRAIYHHEADYAVQAGGHSQMTGWNNVDDGVLIHFEDMNSFSYNAEADSVTLQPGVRWGDALKGLQQYNVAVAGGRLGDVGTGLLLGGGFCYWSPQVGWSASTIREADVVLTNGTLVTANADNEHADLFKCLKGGGNRFGIVTRFEVDAIHTGPNEWYGGLFLYDNSTATELLDAFTAFVRDTNDPKSSVMQALTYGILPNGTITSTHLVAPMYNGPSFPDGMFDAFISIPHTTYLPLGPLSYNDGVATILDSTTGGGSRTFGTNAQVGDDDLFYDTYASFNNLLYTLAADPGVRELGLTLGLGFNSIPQSQIEKSRERGGTVIDPTDGNYALIYYESVYMTNVTERLAIESEGTINFLNGIKHSPGKPFYLNESDKRQMVFETYGQYEFMKHVYAKYDPTRFNVRHSAGPSGL
ncbi:FAD-binding domain-containing protein [Atractiella rhizophila]|nr:FAD-binding domain-containing protein [Atractiella rhizophila]